MSNLALLHCSDCHFGAIPIPKQFDHRWPWNMANPHSWTLLRGLVEAEADVATLTGLAESERPIVLMSGDLTATGHAEEFIIAQSFFRSQWRYQRLPTPNALGFDHRDVVMPSASEPALTMVSGNHDQWNGNSYWRHSAFNPLLRDRHFRHRRPPWPRTWTDGDLTLELWGLDSSAGWSPAQKVWRQQGELDLSVDPDLNKTGEVDFLEKRLQQSPAPGSKFWVRALMIHHSVHSGLRPTSRQKLLDIAQRHRFAVVLTGHTHDFLRWPEYTAPPADPQRRILWELRCASTVQGPPDRIRPSPGFLAHRIQIVDQGIQWKSWRFQWDDSLSQFAQLDPDTKPFADIPVA